ncbi:hypothetical protein HanPSC8_Chr04g0184481 [Helianthus annuus]|nr:hypothetical protein HanPSC8_Chr04g0184481 [Helianthus annuus]
MGAKDPKLDESSRSHSDELIDDVLCFDVEFKFCFIFELHMVLSVCFTLFVDS